MIKYFIAFFITTTLSLYAWLEPDPGKFAIQGEILWLHASLEDTSVAIEGFFDIEDIRIPNQERFHKNFNFHPAYRLEGAYSFCNGLNDFRFRGTYFANTVTLTRTFPPGSTNNFFPTQLPPSVDNILFNGVANVVSSKAKVIYYSLDAIFGQNIYACYPFNLTLQGGLHYLHLKADELYSYTLVLLPTPTLSANAQYNNSMWGVGPECGIDIRYLLPSWASCFCGDLSFVANAKGALLVARNHAKLFSITDVTSVPHIFYDTENSPDWRVITAFDFQLGFNYLLRCNCFTFSLEGGYELANYQKAINKIRIFNDFQHINNGVSIDKYGDFGLHGPYLAIGLSY